MIYALIAGLMGASLHVISGPDHLAAVTPLVIESKGRSWKIGFSWGMGHLMGMLLIGCLFLLFKDLLPLEMISSNSELLVAIVLIILGLWVFYKIYFSQEKSAHSHQQLAFVGAPTSDAFALWSSLGIGILHGLAGIAHFILLLPVLGFATYRESSAYILGFGLGTILAMSIYAFVLGRVSRFAHLGGSASFTRTFRILGGAFVFLVGIYWLYLGF